MWQVIDLNKIEKELAEHENLEDQMKFLGLRYPSLLIFIIRYLELPKKLEAYMNECKKYGAGWMGYYGEAKKRAS